MPNSAAFLAGLATIALDGDRQFATVRVGDQAACAEARANPTCLHYFHHGGALRSVIAFN